MYCLCGLYMYQYAKSKWEFLPTRLFLLPQKSLEVLNQIQLLPYSRDPAMAWHLAQSKSQSLAGGWRPGVGWDGWKLPRTPAFASPPARLHRACSHTFTILLKCHLVASVAILCKFPVSQSPCLPVPFCPSGLLYALHVSFICFPPSRM